MITLTILLNCILNDIATCNFYFSVSDYVCTLMLKTILIVKCDYHTCQLPQIQQQSPGLPYGSLNFPNKFELWAFRCFNLEGGGGGGRGVNRWYSEGVMQKKEFPNFRIPEVGIFGLCTITSANTLIPVVHLTIKFFRQLPAFTCYFHCSITSCHFIHSLIMTHFTSNYYYTHY